jgi:hypothetical protein
VFKVLTNWRGGHVGKKGGTLVEKIPVKTVLSLFILFGVKIVDLFRTDLKHCLP